MKKALFISLTALCIVVAVIFRGDIGQILNQNETVQNITSKMMGVEPANTTVADVGNAHYAYSTLNETEKMVYNQMADCLLGFAAEVTLSTHIEDEAEQAFHCLMSDHPEIFWCSAYELTTYNISGVDSKYTFRPVYAMTQQEAAQYQAKIDAYVSACMTGVNGMTDEYEIAKYFYEYIIRNTDYNSAAENNQNICSVFVDGESVCMGYSKAFQYLLQQTGIQSSIVSGTSENEAHAWNLVRLNGIYSYVDITWGDPEFTQVEADYIDYTFFGITQEELLKTHGIDNVYELPECTSTSLNYFRVEGLYLDVFDKTVVANMIERQFETQSYIAIQCKDDEVYQQLYNYLIDQSNISRFITGSKVHYAENPEYHILTIFQP